VKGSRHENYRHFEKDCFDVYQPDATFAGGIAQVKKVLDRCRETGQDAI